jgi:hypothetical protein
MMRIFQRANVTSQRLALAALAILALSMVAAGYPKPAPVPYRWELNFDAGPLRLYVDPHGSGAYWFFTYTVTNRTGKDQLWAPRFTLFTDAGEILDSGRDVPTRVTDDLLDLLANPYLLDQNMAIGDILQGRENAREGLVVWPARNLKVTEMSLFIAGISGETARVKNPVNGNEVLLRKTLQRDYIIPGDAGARGTRPVQLVYETWVMR